MYFSEVAKFSAIWEKYKFILSKCIYQEKRMVVQFESSHPVFNPKYDVSQFIIEHQNIKEILKILNLPKFSKIIQTYI